MMAAAERWSDRAWSNPSRASYVGISGRAEAIRISPRNELSAITPYTAATRAAAPVRRTPTTAAHIAHADSR